LSELEGSLKTNYTKDLVEFSEFENTLSPSDSELQKLWEVKKNTFKKLDIQLYENLKKSKGVNSQLKSLSSLYKTPYADGAIEIKLGWIRQQMKK
jgi:intein-encoded DNA endonuclease-like protein